MLFILTRDKQMPFKMKHESSQILGKPIIPSVA